MCLQVLSARCESMDLMSEFLHEAQGLRRDHSGLLVLDDDKCDSEVAENGQRNVRADTGVERTVVLFDLVLVGIALKIKLELGLLSIVKVLKGVVPKLVQLGKLVDRRGVLVVVGLERLQVEKSGGDGFGELLVFMREGVGHEGPFGFGFIKRLVKPANMNRPHLLPFDLDGDLVNLQKDRWIRNLKLNRLSTILCWVYGDLTIKPSATLLVLNMADTQ